MKSLCSPSITQQSQPTPSLSIKGRLISGGAWVLAGRIMTAITALALNALLARLLIPEELGAYFLIFSLISAAAVFAQLGLNHTVVQLVAGSLGTAKPGRARAAVRITFRFGALGAVFVFGVLVVGIGHWLARQAFDSPLMAAVMDLAAVWAVVLTFQSLLAETFRGFNDIRLATIFGGLVTSLLSVVLFSLLWIIHGHSSLDQVIILSIASVLVSVLIAGPLLYGKVINLEGSDGLDHREVIAMSWPLFITNLTFFVLTQVDIWIVGAFLLPEEVAIYGAALRLITLVTTSLFIVNSIVSPLIAEMYAQDKKKELERVLQTTATLAGIPSILVAVSFIFLGGPILGLVFGDFYREGAIVLALLSVGQLVNVLTGSCGLTLIMTGHQATMMRITLIFGALTVGGAVWLVKDYGMIGVASVIATGLILQNIFMWYFAYIKSGIRTHARLSLLPVYQLLFKN